MNKKQIMKITIIGLLVISMLIALLFICPHKETTTVISISPTCVDTGSEDIVCLRCEKVLSSSNLKPTGHCFENYHVTTEPYKDQNGIEESKCENCEQIDRREYICPHDSITTHTILDATCINDGQENDVCDRCKIVIDSRSIKANGHSVENYELTTNPTPTENGIQSGTCTTCQETVNIEYICTHEKASAYVVSDATCQKEGSQEMRCDLCQTVTATKVIEKTSCDYSDWKISTYATPFESGTHYKTCIYCNNKISDQYSMTMPSANALYIPGTGICHTMHVGGLSQGVVDTYDLACGTNYYGVTGTWILGHNYGTMKSLHKTKVGQYVYVSIDGEVQTYIVRYSEFAMQNNSKTNIIGQSSGLSIFEDIPGYELRMYTCYGGTNGRWMVLAERIS